MDPDRFLAVQNALTPDQRARILKNFGESNPHWRGAHVADILAALTDSDSYLEVTEPLLDDVDLNGPSRISLKLRPLLVPAALALFLADSNRDVAAVVKLVERAHWISLPSMYAVVRSALIDRGWAIDDTAKETASGELHEFIHPETGQKMAWLDAYLAESGREVALGKPER